MSNKRNLSSPKTNFSPRRVKFYECCINQINSELLNNKARKKRGYDPRYKHVDILRNANEKDYLDLAFENYLKINKPHFSSSAQNRFEQDGLKCFIKRNKSASVENSDLFVQNSLINEKYKLKGPIKIAFANTKVDVSNNQKSRRRKPQLNSKRFNTLARMLKQTDQENADMLLLPEFFLPYEWLSSLAKYSERTQRLIVTGLEHWTSDNTVYNFIVTICPLKVNGIKDAVVLIRLKNHYAPLEEFNIRGDQGGMHVPKPKTYLYDIINWRGLYFAPFYCYELADIAHRTLMRSKIDLLVVSEYNSDTNYFSDIVSAVSRDIHCYVAQVNSSDLGDTRLTKPSKTESKNMLRLKGGTNDTILIGEIDIDSLRAHQMQLYDLTKDSKQYKPVPPEFDLNFVRKRIKNSMLFDSGQTKSLPPLNKI